MKNELLERCNVANNALTEILKQERLLRLDMCELIHSMLIETGDIIFGPDYDGDWTSVSYDGGRHPEYDSSLYEVIEAIKPDTDRDGNKTFKVDLEGNIENYEEERMNFDDVWTVFDCVCGYYEDWVNKKEKQHD